MSQEVSLFGNPTSGALGPVFSTQTSRQVRREVEQAQTRGQVALANIAVRHQIAEAELASKATLRAAEEHAQSYLTATALCNTATLVAQAKAHAKTAPEGAHLYEAIVTAYAQGAIQRLQKGL